MNGIEYFPKLKKLDCTQCGLRALNVSGNKELEELNCSDNYLEELNVKKNKKLKDLFCSDNMLKKLELKKLSNLKEICCGGNQLKKLDVTHNKKLITLECDRNKLTFLNVSKNKQLDYLHCGDNRIRKLDLSKNRLLQTFRCDGNRMITGNVKLSRTQLERCEAASQKATIRRKKIGKYYYLPLQGVLRTNVISNLSYGKITSKGIRGKKRDAKNHHLRIQYVHRWRGEDESDDTDEKVKNMNICQIIAGHAVGFLL